MKWSSFSFGELASWSIIIMIDFYSKNSSSRWSRGITISVQSVYDLVINHVKWKTAKPGSKCLVVPETFAAKSKNPFWHWHAFWWARSEMTSDNDIDKEKRRTNERTRNFTQTYDKEFREIFCFSSCLKKISWIFIFKVKMLLHLSPRDRICATNLIICHIFAVSRRSALQVNLLHQLYKIVPGLRGYFCEKPING